MLLPICFAHRHTNWENSNWCRVRCTSHTVLLSTLGGMRKEAAAVEEKSGMLLWQENGWLPVEEEFLTRQLLFFLVPEHRRLPPVVSWTWLFRTLHNSHTDLIHAAYSLHNCHTNIICTVYHCFRFWFYWAEPFLLNQCEIVMHIQFVPHTIVSNFDFIKGNSLSIMKSKSETMSVVSNTNQICMTVSHWYISFHVCEMRCIYVKTKAKVLFMSSSQNLSRQWLSGSSWPVTGYLCQWYLLWALGCSAGLLQRWTWVTVSQG